MKKTTTLIFSLLPPVTGEDHEYPDEDIDGVHINTHGSINGVVLLSCVVTLLGFRHDLLGVIQHESSEDDETTISDNRLKYGSSSTGSRYKHSTDGSDEDTTEGQRQRTTVLQKLLVRCTSCCQGECSYCSCSVCSSPEYKRTTHETHRSNNTPNNTRVDQPRHVFSVETGFVGESMAQHGTTDHRQHAAPKHHPWARVHHSVDDL